MPGLGTGHAVGILRPYACFLSVCLGKPGRRSAAPALCAPAPLLPCHVSCVVSPETFFAALPCHTHRPNGVLTTKMSEKT